MRDVFENYKKYTDGAKRQAYRSRTEFSLDKMSEKLINILETKVPKQTILKLPQLKKIALPTIKKGSVAFYNRLGFCLHYQSILYQSQVQLNQISYSNKLTQCFHFPNECQVFCFPLLYWSLRNLILVKLR